MTQDQWERGEGWREDLSELRGFICDHMDVGDAGRACSLLSAVSRHANVIDAENKKLRKLAIRMWPFAKAYLNMQPMLGIPDSESYDIGIELSELHII